MTGTSGQYGTSAPLESRISLHDRFSRNPQGWFPWVRGLLRPQLAGRVLDVGCGTGAFWVSATDDLARCSEITLVDASDAMVSVARQRLAGEPRVQFRTCDAQRLPFSDGSFDVLIALHMLYDVPDMQAALAEFSRVTETGGLVAISTNGVDHLRELDELVAQHVPEASWGDIPVRFTLENAEAILAGRFPHVRTYRYEDELWITDADAVADWAAGVPGAVDLTAFRRAAADLIEHSGGIRVTKSSGCMLLM